MTARQRKYVRVYFDDLWAEFPAVCGDAALLGTWLQLLVLAERSYPATPELPRSVRGVRLAALIEAGLIAVNGHHYNVRGLIAERTRRGDAAKRAADKRWHSDGNAAA